MPQKEPKIDRLGSLADRITFEEIYQICGKTESEVIKLCEKN